MLPLCCSDSSSEELSDCDEDDDEDEAGACFRCLANSCSFLLMCLSCNNKCEHTLSTSRRDTVLGRFCDPSFKQSPSLMWPLKEFSLCTAIFKDVWEVLCYHFLSSVITITVLEQMQIKTQVWKHLPDVSATPLSKTSQVDATKDYITISARRGKGSEALSKQAFIACMQG